jgi:large subunit ribosomal protein L4e
VFAIYFNLLKMTARPVVSVYTKESAIAGQVEMPAVFTAPIRDDTVSFVHSNMNKNRRQAHGVSRDQGMQHSAESWGTGRAVARIPRIGGSGTHRSGQAAFGNMCRKGRMFAPLRTWRKWHRKVNTNQKRHAVASALAASACAPLVLARGHKCDAVPELPLVVDSLNVESTHAILKALTALGAGACLAHSRAKKTRAGAGKMRYSRFTQAKGPLVVYGDENPLLKRTARNLPGVDTCSVHRLNLLQLAPGGHLGRFVIYTKDAFTQLDKIFGTYREKGIEKSGYQLNRSCLAVADLARIINSDQVQSKLREIRHNKSVARTNNKNPLKNKVLMQRLNPYAKTAAALEAKAAVARQTARKAALKQKMSKAGRKEKAVRTTRHNALAAGLEDSFKAAHQVILDEIKAGQFKQEDSDEEESDE